MRNEVAIFFLFTMGLFFASHFDYFVRFQKPQQFAWALLCFYYAPRGMGFKCINKWNISSYDWSTKTPASSKEPWIKNKIKRCFLPPAFWRNGKGTVFTGVCLATFRGGGTHSWPIGGYSHLADRGYSHQADGGGTLGYPSHWDWMGVPPCWDWIWVSHQNWMGVPHLTHETEQQGEHLLCGGQYASCVHAEGLLVLYLTLLRKKQNNVTRDGSTIFQRREC